MSIVESYLNFLNENKWKSLLRAGKINNDQLRRIQKYRPSADKLYVKSLLKKGDTTGAQEYLAKKGIIKSARAWLAGVEKGNKNLILKNKINVHRNQNNSKESYMSKSEDLYDINLARTKTLKNKNIGDDILTKRHEIDEVGLHKKLSSSSNVGVNSSLGSHVSDEVLRREKELMDTSKSLYSNKRGNLNITKFRKQTGEYDILPSKKEIKKMDIITKKNLGTKIQVPKNVSDFIKKKEDELKLLDDKSIDLFLKKRRIQEINPNDIKIRKITKLNYTIDGKRAEIYKQIRSLQKKYKIL